MEKSQVVDYIIVGQGLAGSTLAIKLLTKGKKIVVIDPGDNNISSVIAAGLFNPITGRNSTKTWLADTLFTHVHQFYPEAERLTQRNFFFPMPIYRPFVSIEEQNEWMGKSEDAAFKPFVDHVYVNSPYGTQLHDPFGGMLLKQSGYLDTRLYLGAVRDLILARAALYPEYFNDDALAIHSDHIQYKDVIAQKIIFCQGVHAATNKWFKEVPICPLKGEILTINTQWEKHVILNRGVYMVRGGVPGRFRIGSTYNFSDSSPGVTDESRIELEEKLKGLIRFPFEITSQEWGFRPTTPNRRPVLGSHPFSERLVIFNGLGTKGVSLAPYFSDVLLHWLENGRPLDKDINVTRFKLLY